MLEKHGTPFSETSQVRHNRPIVDTIREPPPQHAVMEAYEVEQDFSGIGRRTMLLNARKVFYEENSHTTILLAIEDITERRAMEREVGCVQADPRRNRYNQCAN